MPPRRRINTYTSCSRHSPNADIVWTSGSKFLELACRKKCAVESPDIRLAIEYSDVPLSHPLTSITHVLPATHRNNWCDVSLGAITTARVISSTMTWFADSRESSRSEPLVASRPAPEGGEHDGHGDGTGGRWASAGVAVRRSRRRPSASDMCGMPPVAQQVLHNYTAQCEEIARRLTILHRL